MYKKCDLIRNVNLSSNLQISTQINYTKRDFTESMQTNQSNNF